MVKMFFMKMNMILWVLRIVPAVIMLQTLSFKFTAHPQSVRLFTILDMEPWGRIGIGVFELIASLLLLIPRFTWMGALTGAGLMSGALFFHLTNKNVGIYFEGSPTLFIYALVALACCLLLIYLLRNQIVSTLKWRKI
jgi:uncharacterized membrane protein YphA (DoxX/SURF4 family)